MRAWLAGCLTLLLAITVYADSDPKAVIEPLKIARDTFYQDVAKFKEGKLTEDELVVSISEQFAPLINDRTVALRVMVGSHARQLKRSVTGSRTNWNRALWMPTLVVSQPMVASSLCSQTRV